jgi:hypothetical protein
MIEESAGIPRIMDVEGDGDMDLIGIDTIWINESSGNFSEMHLPYETLNAADFDQDGDLDFLTKDGLLMIHHPGYVFSQSEMIPNQRSLYPNQWLTPEKIRQAELQDFDGDGDIDIWLETIVDAYCCYDLQEILLINQQAQGMDAFTPIWKDWGEYTFIKIFQSDLNASLIPDIITKETQLYDDVSSDGFDRFHICLQMDRGIELDSERTILFSGKLRSNFGNLPEVLIHDFDIDGDKDLYMLNHFWINDGDNHFTETNQGLYDNKNLGTNFGIPTIQFGDLDNDGDLDAVKFTYGNRRLEIWKNQVRQPDQ